MDSGVLPEACFGSVVRFYHAVGPEELYEIWSTRLNDLVYMADSYRSWLDSHVELLDKTL